MFRFLLFSLLLFPFVLKAQVSILGKVTDEKGGIIPYAQIVLKSLPDSAILKTDIADSAGLFEISVSDNTQLLQVHATGYKDDYVTITKQQTINVVLKSAAHELKMVSVTASKPMLERRPDRIIFNVSSSIAATGSDVYELIKKAPGVRVNENRGISIIGKNAVSIMINNKLQQVSGTELVAILRSIPAADVEKIEIITTPPAKYDAQGNSGIINIVSKRSAKEGLNGNLGGNYIQRLYGSGRINENLNYRKGKFNVYSTGITNYLKFQFEQKTTVPYGTTEQVQLLEQTNNPLYNRYQLGADYNLTSSSIIGALLTVGSTNRITDQFYNAPVTTFGHLDSTQRTIAKEYEYALRKVANINYEWKIDSSGRKLNVDLDYFTRTENDDRSFNSQTFLLDGTPQFARSYNKSTAGQKVDISSAKADVVWPIKAVELSVGIKVSSIHTNSDNGLYHQYLNRYVVDSNSANRFDYKENTQAAYISASGKTDKWEYQLGLRAENTQTMRISSLSALANTNNYLSLFPTAYLQYSANEDNVFNVNYSRRIDRPDYDEMNPFRQYGAGKSYETGNPFLQPSFDDNIELGYSLMSKYEFTVFGGVENRLYTRVSKVDTVNNTFYYLYENAGTVYNAGLRAAAELSPLPWWEANVQLESYYNKVSSDYYAGKAMVNGIIAWEVQATNNFILNEKKTLLAEISFEYQSRQLDELSEHRYYYSLGAGIKALFFDKKLTLALYGSDMLRSELMYFKNIYNGVLEDNYFDSRALNFSVNWKFGNNKVNAKRQRDSETDEMKRYQ